MLILKESVERKGRVLKNNPYMRKNLLRFVEDPDVINDEVVYVQFKTVLPLISSALANTQNTSRKIYSKIKKIWSLLNSSPKSSLQGQVDISSTSTGYSSLNHFSKAKRLSTSKKFIAKLMTAPKLNH